MFDQLRLRLKAQRHRRRIHRTTDHLNDHALRDIGLEPRAYRVPDIHLNYLNG